MNERVLMAEQDRWLPRRYSELLELAGINARGCADFRNLGDLEVYAKYSSVRPDQYLKNSFRKTAPWITAPRIREFRNLERLRELGVPTPRPVVAGELRQWGFLKSHLLMTERIHESRDLYRLVTQGFFAESRLKVLIGRIGKLVGYMHELGFCHRDLFLRNILVSEIDSDTPQLYFLDCHKGAWSTWRFKGIAYDLGCFEKWAGTLFSTEARTHFYAGYLAARPSLPLERTLAKVNIARKKLVARYLNRKRRHHQDKRAKPTLELESVDPKEVKDLARHITLISSPTDAVKPVLEASPLAHEESL